MTQLVAALAEADAIADRFLASRKIPGVAYGIVAGGDLVHSRGVGTLRVGEDAPPDADSVFRIASMTKSFTAATLVSLRDAGRLSFDDPVALHVPELAELRLPTRDSRPLTVRDLMTMSAGLATDDPWGDRQQGLDLTSFSELLRGPLTFAWPPGTHFEYSNLGYGILGRVITKVAGKEYKDAVREQILQPLGMTATTYEEAEVPPDRLARGYLWRDEAYIDEPMDPYGALASMGGVYSSVRDLARWVAFFADAFPARDDPEGPFPLSRASRREMQQVHRSIGPEVELPRLAGEPLVTGSGYGFGLFIGEDNRFGRIVGHSGGYPGFGSNMRWHLASGLGVIVLGNHRYAPSALLARDLISSLLEADVVGARRITPAPATTAARATAERLLAAWDDDLAARSFAMNIELDEPVAIRRAALDEIRERHGRLSPDPELPSESDTPLDESWWLAGERGGRVRVDILLTPQATPLIQRFAVTSVAEPSAELRAVADTVVDALNADRVEIPASLHLDEAVDVAGLRRALRHAAAEFAPIRLGPAVECDGAQHARWRLRTERTDAPGATPTLELTVERNPEDGVVGALSVTQRSPRIPPYAD